MGIKEDEAGDFFKKIHFQIKNFTKDEIIVVAGETVLNLNIII
jgi:hypothetical protein